MFYTHISFRGAAGPRGFKAAAVSVHTVASNGRVAHDFTLGFTVRIYYDNQIIVRETVQFCYCLSA